MKIAIPLPDKLFLEIGACARELKLTRSGLIAQAAREFLVRRGRATNATAAWNQALDEAAFQGFR